MVQGNLQKTAVATADPDVVVVVSKGHYAKASGVNTGAVGIDGFSEFDLVGAVGDALMENLARLSIAATVAPRAHIPARFRYVAEVMARYPGPPPRRVAFVDIHANDWDTGEPRGTETFVVSPESKSAPLATLLHHNLLEGFRALDSTWKDRGIKYAHYMVFDKATALLSGVKPRDFNERYFCTLVELGFISNETDARVLAHPAGVLAAGRALAEGIREWLNLNV